MAKQWDEITVLTQPLALCLVKAIVPDIVRQCVCVCLCEGGIVWRDRSHGKVGAIHLH